MANYKAFIRNIITEYWKKLTLLVCLSSAWVATHLVPPKILAILVDYIQQAYYQGPDHDIYIQQSILSSVLKNSSSISNYVNYNIMLIGGLLILSKICIGIFGHMFACTKRSIIPVIELDISNNIFTRIVHHQYSYFHGRLTSEITHKLSALTSASISTILLMTQVFVPCFIEIAIVGIIFTLQSKYICVMYLIRFLFEGFLYHKFMPSILNSSAQISVARHHAQGIIGDIINNILVVKTYCSYEYESKTVLTNQLEIKANYRKYLKNLLTFSMFRNTLSILLQTAVLYLIYQQYQASIISVGNALYMCQLMFDVESSMWHVAMHSETIFSHMGDIKNALDYLAVDNAQYLEQRDNALNNLTVTIPKISLKNISLKRKTMLFDNINLDIKAYEKVAIVGPSGAGKSTLMHIMMGIIAPDTGQVLVDNLNINQHNASSYMNKIAYIPQGNLIFNRSVLSNIAYGQDSTLVDKEIFTKAASVAKIDKFIESLSEQECTIISNDFTSGGQAQRIMFARSMYKDTEILFIDEVTSAQDTHNEKCIAEVIKSKKATIVAIAHRLQTIKNFDRIILLDQGRIIAQGTHKELLQESAMYQQLFDNA